MSDATAPAAADAVEYTIRRKVFKLFGAAFHIYDRDGNVVGYSKQKAFKLKEDIRIYRDESMDEEWLKIAARSVIDFSAAYDVTDSRTGELIGTLRRKGLKSMFRDAWEVLDGNERPVGHIQEDSALMATIRRLTDYGWIFPQKFTLTPDGGGPAIAHYSTNFNPFVHKLKVDVHGGNALHPFVPLAAGILLVAIEGKQ
ncbi:hypothetical protein [Alienimonas sp. DA493]|uniref:hypothetical protein n=1 Tax=Alienimonas sp. DA493 TaxID=3373605 RepID=UPI00375514C8